MINKKVFIASVLSGVGVGLAMMPIFNQEVKNLEEYDIDIHDNTTSFAISTINTLVVTSLTSSFFLYKYFTSKDGEHDIEQSRETNYLLNAGKIASFVSSLIPLGLLWNVELNDRETDGSEGFDKFIAWATVSTLPLVMYKTINTYHEIENFLFYRHNSEDELELSLGGKMSVYGITALSSVARGISFTYLLNELQEKLDIEENISLPISVVVGGILANIITGVSEFSDLKKLFQTKTDNLNWQKVTLSLMSTIEGGWFALPLVTKGLQATKNWNELAKGALFFPYFLSHMNSEAREIYKSLLCNSKKIQFQESTIDGDEILSSISEEPKIQELLGDVDTPELS